MAEDRAAPYLSRLDAVRQRCSALAGAHRHGLSAADPASGERWDQGQIWAHCAEFVPYWVDQLERVRAAWRGQPVPFGRTTTDPVRIAAIERDRTLGIAALHARVITGMEALRAHLGGMATADWEVQGLHPTLGVMGVDAFLEEFLVGHLEQHARQLEGL